MGDLHLTPEMIAGIEALSERIGVSQDTILRRAIFSYLAKFDPPAPEPEPEVSNVVSLHGGGNG